MNLLVRPQMTQVGRPPLGMMYLAGMDADTEIWDVFKQGEPDDYIKRTKPRVVGVTVMTRERRHAFRTLRIAKEAGCITVAGGPHISVMAKQVAQFDYIDHLSTGDGERIWKALCNNPKEETDPTKKIYYDLIKNLDEIPQPRWDWLTRYHYDDHNITLGRGCDGTCIFCSTWWVSGKYRHHGVEWITEALDRLWRYGARHLVWEDDCLTNDEECVNILIQSLSKYQFKCLGVTRVDKFDEYAARELSKVGFNTMTFGIESGSQAILDKIHKKTDLSLAFRARDLCRRYNIRFLALMMTGFPFETEETRREDLEFRRKLAPDEWGSIGHIMVMPGTALYQQLKREGKIDDDYWLSDNEYMKLENK